MQGLQCGCLWDNGARLWKKTLRRKRRHDRHHLSRCHSRRLDLVPEPVRPAPCTTLSQLSGRHRHRGVFGRRDTPDKARSHPCRHFLCLGLFNRFRHARRHGIRLWSGCATLSRLALSCRGHCHYCHGPPFPRGFPPRTPVPRSASPGRKAGRTLGRLCDGPRFRLWLDTLHRPGSCRHSRRRLVGGECVARGHAADGLFLRPRHSLHSGGFRHGAFHALPAAFPVAPRLC